VRTEGDFIKLNKKLLPLSWLYGLGVGFRNTLFEMGILKSRSFSTPVISVGNITVGGTGKTPHVEYLIQLLKDNMNVAVLSRGYKRKSHGFVLADKDTPMSKIGDEPYQIKQKFPNVTVAVDGKRTRGIENLTSKQNGDAVDVILLDDAFQHRYVKPGINILLVDYHRLVIYDELLPAGRLREPVRSKDRADIVIITKCPKDLKPMEFRVITKAMSLFPYQQLYFSTHEYDAPKPVFPEQAKAIEQDGTDKLESLSGKNILLLTGIASPKQMIHDLTPKVAALTPLSFGDHHQFKKKDVECINEAFNELPSPKLIITTEKDATRLTQVEGLSDEVKKNMYILPIHIVMMQDQGTEFNKNIFDYVYKNSRNSILVKRKDDHKSQDSNSTGNRPRTISFRNN
jgi:tetraacyldisaccharide 4'-kinase